ncbi:hypothetical protein DPMN_010606 [Dreissena polymorpha]|uniref:Uncharacterized protein n=1 Tax=Dreissena polymorpha TaxID=45954 RepID=A0A9D4N077_DREPO|nr:hypothetical protein DPMN_010606 [Dreissena polymorpha]
MDSSQSHVIQEDEPKPVSDKSQSLTSLVLKAITQLKETQNLEAYFYSVWTVSSRRIHGVMQVYIEFLRRVKYAVQTRRSGDIFENIRRDIALYALHGALTTLRSRTYTKFGLLCRAPMERRPNAVRFEFGEVERQAIFLYSINISRPNLSSE